jgi:signal transduction histidine kinase
MIRDFVHPDDRPLLAAYLERQKQGCCQQIEYRITRPDGEVRSLLRFGELMRDENGRPLRNLIAIQDVTELRKAQKARDEYLQQLHHAQRLDALGTLAGGIAHDLNNTLVPILALTKLVRAGAACEDDRRNLEVIQHAGERARDLVRQVLAFSRNAPEEYRRVDLSSTIADSLRLLRAGMDERITLTERLAEGATIYADPGQIHQVVVNLVTNAAQAIGDREGLITVTLEPGPADTFRLVVADDGVGMDAPTLGRMFEPFFTTRPVGAGAGLGLSIVHGIVTGHGGSVAASSNPGHGTSIMVSLPSRSDGNEAVTQQMAAA